jgi:EmrB/QacA subfamily drug resistance transporter
MRRSLLFASLIIQTAMIFFDASALSVALPSIQRDIGASDTGVIWIVNAYLLGLASFVVAGGRAADVFGTRRLFAIGLIFFAVASVLCGIASGEVMLIFSRAFQGVGAAIMGPASMKLLLESYPESRRGRIIGLLVSISSLFLAFGPFLGGAITEIVSWRAIFGINIPLALLGLSTLYGVHVASHNKASPSFDVEGLVWLTLFLSIFTVGIMMGREWGWLSPAELGCMSTSGIVSLHLLRSLRGKQSPIIDFSLNKIPTFFFGLSALLLIQFISMFTLFAALFFQDVLLLSPIEAGIVTAAATLPTCILAPLSGYLSDTFGPHLPISIGFMLVIIGLSSIGMLTPTYHISHYVLGLVSFGSGLALVMTPLGATVAKAIPADKQGMGMGMYNMSRHIGGLLGTAIIGSLLAFMSSSWNAAGECTPFFCIARLLALIAMVALGCALYACYKSESGALAHKM